MTEPDPLKRPQKMRAVEGSLEKFVSQRRTFFEFVRGLLLGGLLLAEYLLVTYLTSRGNGYLLMMVMNNAILVGVAVAMAIRQVANLFEGSSRWFAFGLLFMLVILVCLALLGSL